jgi:hypothetical protein
MVSRSTVILTFTRNAVDSTWISYLIINIINIINLNPNGN